MLNFLVDGLRGLARARVAGPFKEKRKLVRIQCRYDLTCASGRRVDQAVLTEVGLGGVRLDVPHRYGAGTMLDLTFPPAPQYYEHSTIRCQVAWCRKRRYRDVISLGATYCDTPENLSRSWARFLFQAMGLEERPLDQQRSYLRVPGRLPGGLVLYGGGGILEGTVDDLSLGGALLRSIEGFRAGSQGAFQLGPYAHLPQVELPAEVVNLTRSPEGSMWLHGIRFTVDDTRRMKAIGRYLIALLKESQ